MAEKTSLRRGQKVNRFTFYHPFSFSSDRTAVKRQLQAGLNKNYKKIHSWGNPTQNETSTSSQPSQRQHGRKKACRWGMVGGCKIELKTKF